MKEWLLIDGYNVNNWKEFKTIREENLEHAREMLLAVAAEYAAFKGQEVIPFLMRRKCKGCPTKKVVRGPG